jgi:hypothetical protein
MVMVFFSLRLHILLPFIVDQFLSEYYLKSVGVIVVFFVSMDFHCVESILMENVRHKI